MAFVTGTAASMTDLLTAIRSACVANGWTLAGNVLSKGGCYVALRVLTCPAPSTKPALGGREYLMVKSGNGIDGSNNLTDPAGNEPCIGPFVNNGNATTLDWINWTWPVTYSVHINTAPDEVWIAVKYNGDYYQHIGFGKSPGIGNPGTGVWHFATMPNFAATSSNQSYKVQSSVGAGAGQLNNGAFSNNNVIPQPFWIGGRLDGDSNANSPGLVNYSYHGMRGDTGAASWSTPGNGGIGSFVGTGTGTSCYPPTVPLLARQPNTWNGEALLLPMQLVIFRPSSKTTLQGELAHLRTLRMDFLDPEHVIDLSPDRWRVYPCLKKNTQIPAGGSALDMHSGCFAVAVRYDGP